jgi:hypothetical protein
MLNEHCLFSFLFFPCLSVSPFPAFSLYSAFSRSRRPQSCQSVAAVTPLVEGRSLPDSSYLHREGDGNQAQFAVLAG